MYTEGDQEEEQNIQTEASRLYWWYNVSNCDPNPIFKFEKSSLPVYITIFHFVFF